MAATANPTDDRVGRYYDAADGSVVEVVRDDPRQVKVEVVLSGDEYDDGTEVAMPPSHFDAEFDRL